MNALIARCLLLQMLMTLTLAASLQWTMATNDVMAASEKLTPVKSSPLRALYYRWFIKLFKPYWPQTGNAARKIKGLAQDNQRKLALVYSWCLAQTDFKKDCQSWTRPYFSICWTRRSLCNYTIKQNQKFNMNCETRAYSFYKYGNILVQSVVT